MRPATVAVLGLLILLIMGAAFWQLVVQGA